ncbi:MAG: hypothetical protein R2865_01745 [Deinococcales bacterium]
MRVVSAYQQRASWQLADNILTQTWQDNTETVAPLNLRRFRRWFLRMVGNNLNLSSLLFYRLKSVQIPSEFPHGGKLAFG